MVRNAKGGSGNLTESIGGFGGMILLVILLMQFAKLNDAGTFKIAALALTAAMGGLLWWGSRTKVKTPFGSYAAFGVMILGTLNLILDPFHSDDLIVYILAILCLAAVLWICIDLLLLHNRECSNPLPQFESHTGGEGNA